MKAVLRGCRYPNPGTSHVRGATSSAMSRPSAGNGFKELSSLLARGFLRLVTLQNPDPAPIAPHPEPAPGSPNLVDVGGRAKHELVPEGRP
jgi:hypothetical protein